MRTGHTYYYNDEHSISVITMIRHTRRKQTLLTHCQFNS